MSIISTLRDKLKEVLNKMFGSSKLEQVLKVAPIVSSKMENAINLWGLMYKNEAPWLHEPDKKDPTRIVSLGLPALIASEKARMALIEFASEITTPTEEVEEENPNYGKPKSTDYAIENMPIPVDNRKTIINDVPVSDTSRAEYLNKHYTKLKESLRTQLEYGIAKGGLVIKPYVDKNADGFEIAFDFIQPDMFFPLAFDMNGNITSMAFVEVQVESDYIYVRVEKHTYNKDTNTAEIENKAFKQVNMHSTGDILDTITLEREIPLTDVPAWKDLEPFATVDHINQPMFAYFKMPEANTVDTSSPLGVSGFSKVVSLIKDADMQYSRLLWEYEAGEIAIDVDRDALNVDDNDTTHVNHLQKRLYRKVDLGDSGTYQPFTPSLRDSNYIAGLNTILMRIEDATGLSRGTLADVSVEARTATELKILKQRSYSVNKDIQTALQNTLDSVIYIMNIYCELYDITPPGEYDVSYEWDDSILVDVDAELGKQLNLLQNGLTTKKKVIMWYYGMTERQAEQLLEEIDAESTESSMNDLANFSSMMK